MATGIDRGWRWRARLPLSGSWWRTRSPFRNSRYAGRENADRMAKLVPKFSEFVPSSNRYPLSWNYFCASDHCTYSQERVDLLADLSHQQSWSCYNLTPFRLQERTTRSTGWSWRAYLCYSCFIIYINLHHP